MRSVWVGCTCAPGVYKELDMEGECLHFAVYLNQIKTYLGFQNIFQIQKKNTFDSS